MAEYLALYRSFRPRRFAEVVGQEHVTRTLRNAVASGRVAHAYLFSGPRGTGKTSVARILARALNCLAREEGEPCNQCPPCLEVLSGQSLDVVEIDAASHRGIDEVRALRDQARYAPARCSHKVYIVDEVHMLTAEAFNALLKTLEEPPGPVVFVLATTDAHRVPPTVASRCQRFEFHRLAEGEIAGQLRRVLAAIGAEAEEEAVCHLARAADGALRDALTLLDQALAGAAVPGRLTLSDVTALLGSVPDEELAPVLRHVLAGDVVGLLGAVGELHRRGRELRQAVLGLLRLARTCLLARADPGRPTEGSGVVGELVEECRRVPWERLVAVFDGLGRLEQDLRRGGPSLLVLEVGLIQLALGDAARLAAGAPRDSSTAAAGQPGKPEQPRRPEQPEKPEKPEREGGFRKRPDPSDTPGLWKQMMERVRKERPLLHGVLTSARPVALRGEEMIVVFRPNCTFHRDRVSEPKNKAYLEGVLSALSGRPVRLRCQVGQGEEDNGAEPPVGGKPPGEGPGAERRDEAEQGLAVAALEVLGGREVDLELDEVFAAGSEAVGGFASGGEGEPGLSYGL